MRDLESVTGVNVYQVQGSENIGKSRSGAFKMGSSDYVSFADDDDSIYPVGLKAALNDLSCRSDIDVACTRESINGIDSGKLSGIKDGADLFESRKLWLKAHHFLIFRRSVIELVLDEMKAWRNCENYAILASLKSKGFKMRILEHLAYDWKCSETGVTKSKSTMKCQKAIDCINNA